MHRDGNWLLGVGMAAAGYPVPLFMPVQRARARIYADGHAVVQAGTQEFGTGVMTAMTQVGADGLGLPLAAVRFECGNTDLPNISSAVGSAGAGMISAAVHAAATALRDQLIALAVGDRASPLHGAAPADVEVVDGHLRLRAAPVTGESYGELMGRNRLADAEAMGSWAPPPLDTPRGMVTFGAQFAEVAVDPDLGLVRVRRMLGVFAPGRVNADAPDVEVELVEVHDELVNPLGVKGVGEIGQVGVAAAIANAVFHATGRRFRELLLAAELVMDPAGR